MRLLIDFFPLLLFFGAYKQYDIYVATGVLMAATVVQLGLIYAMERRLQTIHKYLFVMVMVFGAFTLYLHDERFIKWKPTVAYAVMAIGLAVAQWGARKNVLKLFLGSQLELPDSVWSRLGLAWIGYCVFMATINAYVAAFHSTDTWVSFKLWGYAFPLAFLIGQGFYIARYLPKDKTEES